MSKFSLLLEALSNQPLRHLVRFQRALKEDARLTDEERFSLRSELVAETNLVADRLQMLDLMPKDGIVAEIGVAAGNFSRLILERCTPKALHLIDPWDQAHDDRYSESSYSRLEKSLARETESGQVILHRGYSNAILPELPEDHFDWVYVDAGHDYESVKEDLKMCKRIVKSGGIIAGHDYIRWVGPDTRYGVLEAVNEFANNTGSPLVFLTNQHDKHDSFALRLNK